jgi:Xaa-Pro aminopeptidase
MLKTSIPSYFEARRQRLMHSSVDTAYVIASNEELIRNNDVTHSFRQDSNFYYLTGWEEPDSFLILVPGAASSGSPTSSRSYRMILFVPPKDPEREMWEGERYGVEGALSVFGADEAYPISEFEKRMPGLLKGVAKVAYRLGYAHRDRMDRMLLDILEASRRLNGRSGRGFAQLADPNEALGEMRLFKTPEEIEIMRKGCSITAHAHRIAMKETRPGMNERDVEAIIDYHFKRGGCARNGYWSIVAGGRNATCLHYRSNNEVLRDGDLLLIDAGGEFEYYSADITRTFPVSQTFSQSQAQVYDLVLKSQIEAIEMVKPGVTLPQIHSRVTEVLAEGFLSLGLLKGTVESVIQTGGFRRFYPHNTSHWLGLDVHDAGLYLKNGEPRKLEAGMVLTIEPGFYVQPLDREAPSQYRDIGIRIEDDILVTATGHENFTHEVPKSRIEIEALRA